MTNFNKQRGFTLIELLVVIAIIGVLSSVVLTSLTTARNKAYDAKVKSDKYQIRLALQSYFAENGHYPFSGANTALGYGVYCIGTGPCKYLGVEYDDVMAIIPEKNSKLNQLAATILSGVFPALVNDRVVETVAGAFKGYVYVQGSGCNSIDGCPENEASVIVPSTSVVYTVSVGSNFAESSDDITGTGGGGGGGGPVTCTGWTYSDWSACSSGTQTRTVTGYTPSGCTGTPSGSPILSQSCSVSGNGTCENPAYDNNYAGCTEHGLCFDSSNNQIGSDVTASQCADIGGYCSNGNWNGNGDGCRSHGVCNDSNSTYDITSSACSELGNCSNSQYDNDRSSCESHGLCSNGTDNLTETECNSIGTCPLNSDFNNDQYQCDANFYGPWEPGNYSITDFYDFTGGSLTPFDYTQQSGNYLNQYQWTPE